MDWWQRGNFYSLYIDAFAGDIKGLISRLDYFVELGVDCLHILPHYPSPMDDDGYDITDHTGVRPELGSVEDFKQLCIAAHEKGIWIMVDLVLNHVSIEHQWFKAARQSKDNPYRDFFLWSETGTEYADAPMIFPDFKDSNWIWNEETQDYYYATFKPSQPELNWRNPAVQLAMFEIVDTLVSYGVDGFRLDAIMNLVERDQTSSVGLPETHERIRDLRAHLDTHHSGVILLGEVIGSTAESKAYFGTGDECHLSYNFAVMNEIFYSVILETDGSALEQVSQEALSAAPAGCAWMVFLRNHDSLTLRMLGQERAAELLEMLDPAHEFRFADGAETAQRLASLLHNEQQVREAFSKLFSLPTPTVMYYGDEIGMQNAPLPPEETDMRRVCRAPFDWELADQQMSDESSLWHFVRACMKTRNDKRE